MATAMSMTGGQQPGTFIEGHFESAYGGGTRRYKLWVPSAPAPTSGRALVVILHGCTQDADDIARGTRLNERAGAPRGGRGWLVLYPEQPASANGKKCWNWYDPAHQARGAGEPALLAALIVDIARRHGADTRRVFVGGISAGAAMAVNLVVAYPELFAAAAAHSGIPYLGASGIGPALAVMRDGAPAVSELPALRVPLLVLHGERDAVVNPRNGAQLAAQWSAAIAKGRGGAVLLHREEEGRSSDGREFRRTVYSTSDGPPLLEQWMIRDLGHAWSGGSASGTFTDEHGPDATTIMLDFFARHDVRAQPQ